MLMQMNSVNRDRTMALEEQKELLRRTYPNFVYMYTETKGDTCKLYFMSSIKKEKAQVMLDFIESF